MEDEKPLTKEELLEELWSCVGGHNPEQTHAEADDLLIRYINDKEIAEVYEKIEKWYA